MDWLLNHPQVLFLIVIAVVAMLQKLKQSHGRDAAGPAPATDQEDAERTRRIQAEIRRRIRERRGLAPAAPPPVSEAEEPAFPPSPPMIEEVRPVVVPPPLPVEDMAASAGVAAEFDRQQKIFERLQAFKAARQASAAAAPPASMGVAAPAVSGRFMADLRSPAGLRRAIVLSEILNPPLGLR